MFRGLDKHVAATPGLGLSTCCSGVARVTNNGNSAILEILNKEKKRVSKFSKLPQHHPLHDPLTKDHVPLLTQIGGNPGSHIRAYKNSDPYSVLKSAHGW